MNRRLPFILSTLLTLLLLSCGPLCAEAPAGGAETVSVAIPSWTETVDLQPDGSARVTARVSFERLAPGHLELPCSFARTVDTALEIDGPAAGRIENRAGVNLLALEISGTPAPDQPLTISYLATGVFDPSQAPKTDFGNIEAKYQFVNTVLVPIASFTGVVLLPPGLVVNAVDSYLPKLKKEDPNDPYTFDLVDGRRRMTIVVNAVKPGDRVMLNWRMKSTSRSPWLVLGLLLVSIGWLAAFRDIVAPPPKTGAEKVS